MDHESNDDEEIAILEDDPELVPRRPTQQNPSTSSVMVTYDILHSPTYQVPVLYLHLSPTKTCIPSPIDPEALYNLLVPPSMHAQLAHIGVVGALTQTEHPLTGMTVWFVHPCRTGEVMSTVLDGDGDFKGSDREVRYLLAWFGVVGSGAGLNVSVKLAENILVRTCDSSRGHS